MKIVAKYEYRARGIAFGVLTLLLQITFFVLYCVLVNYGTPGSSQFIFPFFNNTNFTNTTCCTGACAVDKRANSILLGFGMLFGIIKCTTLMSVGFLLFLMAITLQWAGLVLPWLFQAALDYFQPQYIYMNTSILCDVVYTGLAIAIAYGALVGMISRIQALIFAIFGVVLFAVNRLVVIHYLYVSDVGGSVTMIMFGALYGLAILFALLFRDKHWCCICKVEPPSYAQLIQAVVATCVLIIHWPLFLSDPYPEGSELKERALLNVYFCISSATVMAYAASSFVTPCCKLTVMHVMCGIISGAVVIGSVAPLIIQIWGAILLGAFVGFTVVILIRYMRLIKYVRCDIHDIFWTFAYSGFVGGVASAVMAALVYDTSDEILTLSEFILIYPAIVYGNLGVGSPRTAAEQGGYQMLGVIVTFGIAVAGGLLVGFLIRWVGPLEDDEYFCDSTEWRVCCCENECDRCEKTVTACERVSLPPI